MANVVDYLTSIQKLTDTNLQILKTLNDSFYTKQNHLYAEVNDTTYVIPSFISLENRINALQENFENLIKSPETSEAYFNFDGNTRAIEVRKYSHTPDSIKLPLVNNFNIESNDIFKDFLTPVPYINLSLPELPNDIVEVNVKKVSAKNTTLKELFKNKLSYIESVTNEDGSITTYTKYNTSANISYSEIYKMLLNYKDDADFVEYDTVYKLPIRKNIGSGKYIIESVVSDIIDEDLNELITLKLRTNNTNPSYMNTLTYKMFDDTIEKPLKPGDELLNFDGTGKVKIVEVHTSTNTLVVKVVNGEYLNFIGTDSYDTDNDNDIHDFSKLRFHAATDFTSDKYVKIPLEEDQYIFIAVAPLNSRMNIQSPWGQGLLLDTYKLMDNDNINSFKTYYDKNVKNIGDVLFEMTSMITSPVTELSEEHFKYISQIKPVISKSDLQVMQINKHLNNSTTVKNIRDAYSQKKTALVELSEVQQKINDINTQLTNISFDDTTGIRNVYTAQLSQLNTKKNELNTVITKAMDNISLNVNSTDIPIENAKYRIRGFYVPYNLGTINDEQLENHVIGIRVQYRYKNSSSELGTAVSMNGAFGNYIYSDWNNMSSFDKKKIATCVDGNYSYEYEISNENKNEPSYNQIDIPISQGESVDIRIKVLYDFGQPYITVTSDWSEITNIVFPEEFSKDVPILTIIEENNNDIETNRFNNILRTEGIETHVHDIITDQDITYFHRPDSIASGFYTNERRIIPLKDKLISLSNDIAELKNDVYGSEGLLNVNISAGDIDMTLYSDQENIINLEAYNNFTKAINTGYPYSTDIGTWDIESTDNAISDGAYIYENGIVYVMLNITLSNISDSFVKLYSVFPGSRDVLINNSMSTYVNKDNYINNDGNNLGGVFIKYQTDSNDNYSLQTQNQFITFRTKDAWTGQKYYTSGITASVNNMQASHELPNIVGNEDNGMFVYPYLSNKHGLCIESDNSKSYITIAPQSSIVVPMLCGYKITTAGGFMKKTISFDLRTSLYKDPINYTVIVSAKNTLTIQDRTFIANRRQLKSNWSLKDIFNKRTKYFTTVK
jgi:hypothetical protein